MWTLQLLYRNNKTSVFGMSNNAKSIVKSEPISDKHQYKYSL